ncbi:MAG: hypothetical protein ACE5I1_02960 [bacterium]
MNYVRPASVKEALSLLRDKGILFAGGTILVPKIKYAFENQDTLAGLAI